MCSKKENKGRRTQCFFRLEQNQGKVLDNNHNVLKFLLAKNIVTRLFLSSTFEGKIQL